MRTKQIFLIMLAIGLTCCLVFADGFTNDSTNPVVRKIGDYSMMRGTNGHYTFVNPSEFWNGVWKENSNGWRTQLRVYIQTNLMYIQGVAHPLSTNLMLRVEWGSAVKNSGGGYYMTPNGKFARFELLDAKGNVIPPNPNAGTNFLERTLKSKIGLISFPDISISRKLTYETNLPAWVSPVSESLVADFPKTISTNVYPHIECTGFANSGIVGEIGSVTNRPPDYVGFLKLDEIYSVTNKGDYTLTVQPVLYKRYNHADPAILDRVDLPSVTTKIQLLPSAK